MHMLEGKNSAANVGRLVMAGLVALPALVTASVDSNLGGYGDSNGVPVPQLPRATLPAATESSDCGAYPYSLHAR